MNDLFCFNFSRLLLLSYVKVGSNVAIVVVVIIFVFIVVVSYSACRLQWEYIFNSLDTVWFYNFFFLSFFFEVSSVASYKAHKNSLISWFSIGNYFYLYMHACVFAYVSLCVYDNFIFQENAIKSHCFLICICFFFLSFLRW